MDAIAAFYDETFRVARCVQEEDSHVRSIDAPGGFVSSRVHHVVDFARVGHLDLHEPAFAEGAFVNHARGVVQGIIDSHNFTGERGVHVGRSLDGLNDAEGRLGLNLAADFRQFHVNNVSQFSLYREQRDRIVSLRRSSLIFSRANPARETERGRRSRQRARSRSSRFKAPSRDDAPARGR
jgi:hypothetical protein